MNNDYVLLQGISSSLNIYEQLLGKLRSFPAKVSGYVYILAPYNVIRVVSGDPECTSLALGFTIANIFSGKITRIKKKGFGIVINCKTEDQT